MLHQIKQLQPLIFALNPLKKRKQFQGGRFGISISIAHLRNGGALGVFPAGEVATKKDPVKKFPMDEEWNHKMIRLLSREKVPIIPVYFHARNSKLFYLFSKISPTLRTLRLTSEALSQHKRRIQVRVGNLIRTKDLNPYDSDRALSDFLRAKTFVLSRSWNQKKLIWEVDCRKSPDTRRSLILWIKNYWIGTFKRSEEKIVNFWIKETLKFSLPARSGFPIYCKRLEDWEKFLFEKWVKGQIRKLTLIVMMCFIAIWFCGTTIREKLQQPTRIGFGGEIISAYGIDGFYIASLFHIDASVAPLLEKTIEMGRAFVVKEYQSHPLSLHLLWKGIVHMTIRNPE